MRPLLPDSWPVEAMIFGLAIQVASTEARQLHAATLYRFESSLKIGDLQNHLITRCDSARQSNMVYWIAPDLSIEDQKILAATVESWLAKNSGKIPYSIAHPGGVIFRDDVWVGILPGQGLTCATFIVALFDELGIPFIDKASWEVREGDERWAAQILNLMSPQMTPEHVIAQYDRLGQSVRIRPSDVAAAGCLLDADQPKGLAFEDVNPVAMEVEMFLLGKE